MYKSYCSGHLDAINVTVSFLAVLGSLIAAYFAWYQWQRSCEVKRAETLMELLKLFKEDGLCKAIHSIVDDECKSAMELWYDKAVNYPESRDKALCSVRFISYLQYLKEKGLIEDREELFFRTTIDSIVNNEWFRKFVETEVGISEEIKKRILKTKNANECQHIVENIYTGVQGEDDGVENTTRNLEIEDSMFIENAMIIKINKRYHDNITGQELYEATRRWWRVNVNKAKEMKFVLSVANGVVKEVYEDIKWNEKDEESGRSAFTGKPTTDTYWKKFIGKSVRGLFTRGESNPIKYFYGKTSKG
jgi:hypothetical protein